MDYIDIDQANQPDKIIQIVQLLVILEQKKQIYFDLNAIKKLENSNKYYIVFGYIRNIQPLFSNNRNQNPYYYIPELIYWKILHYFHCMPPTWLTKQWQRDNEKLITFTKAFIQCDKDNDGFMNKASFDQLN
eukprot:31528_1